MFMDSDSFYYSLSYDLTNSVQRQSACEKTNLPLWRKVSALCLFLARGRWAAQWWSWSKPGRSRSTAAEHLVLSPARVQGNKSLQQHGLSCFAKSTDLSVWLQWINWWTLASFPQILPNPACNPAKTALLSFKQVDDRFFWNKHMIEDLISIDVSLTSNVYCENHSLALVEMFA